MPRVRANDSITQRISLGVSAPSISLRFCRLLNHTSLVAAISEGMDPRKISKIFKKALTQFRVSRQKGARDNIMQRLGFRLIGRIVFGGVALGLAALAADSNLPEENIFLPLHYNPVPRRTRRRRGCKK